jgi:hypothetical protein
MAWIRTNQAESGQQVRGVIVAREISEDLLLVYLISARAPLEPFTARCLGICAAGYCV